MKTILFTPALWALLLLVSPNTHADQPQPTYGPAKQLHFDLDHSVDKKWALLSKKLNLTPDQGFQAKQALEDQANKMDLLKKEYLEAKKKIADDTDGAFLGILNPSQQEIYQKIKFDIIGKPDNADDPNLYHGDMRR